MKTMKTGNKNSSEVEEDNPVNFGDLFGLFDWAQFGSGVYFVLEGSAQHTIKGVMVGGTFWITKGEIPALTVTVEALASPLVAIGTFNIWHGVHSIKDSFDCSSSK